MALWIEQKLVRQSYQGKNGMKGTDSHDMDSVPLDVDAAVHGNHTLLRSTIAQDVMELTEIWLDKNYNYFSTQGRSKMQKLISLAN